jgi:hypothetical protein
MIPDYPAREPGLIIRDIVTEFNPFMIARKPFPADQRVVIAVTEMMVVEVALL